MRSLASSTLVVAALLFCIDVHADCPVSPQQTWGATPAQAQPAMPIVDEPVSRARDLLARARLLDEAATADDKSAAEIAARLPTLRTSAKTARDRADRAAGDDRETLVSRAEDLEADLAVSEAETAAKRRTAAENRRVARDLRTRAVQMVREAPTNGSANGCDPPFRFTADGRKIYRVECLK